MTTQSMLALVLTLTQLAGVAACSKGETTAPPGGGDSVSRGTVTVPRATFPSTLGKVWLYRDTSAGAFCDDYGCGHSQRVDTTMVVLDSSLTYQGRSALQLTSLALGAGVTSSGVGTRYVSQGTDGLFVWGSGGGWRMLLSATDTSWSSVSCWTWDHGLNRRVTLSTSQVTVPAGTFSSVNTSYAYSRYGGGLDDISESCYDAYADGVGLLLSHHFYSFSDHMGSSSSSQGETTLLAVDAGAGLPSYSKESEPNDTATAAQLISLGTARIVVAGTAAASDAAAVIADTLVHRDTTGVRRIQDWFRIDLPSARLLNVLLIPGDNNTNFDLYMFWGSPLRVVGRSFNAAGWREWLAGQVAAGTYYVGVQLWSRPPDRQRYWLYVY